LTHLTAHHLSNLPLQLRRVLQVEKTFCMTIHLSSVLSTCCPLCTILFSKALLDAGFLPDDIYYDASPEEIPENAHRQIIHNGESHEVEGDEPEKMTYTQQANKRQHCRRLTSFIRLCDYLITTTMHALAMNSVTKLLERFDKMIQGIIFLSKNSSSV